MICKLQSDQGMCLVYRISSAPQMLQVLIGRNNKENDRLSHKVAAKTDLWFHARGFPGSHTVLRIPAGRYGVVWECLELILHSLLLTQADQARVALLYAMC